MTTLQLAILGDKEINLYKKVEDTINLTYIT